VPEFIHPYWLLALLLLPAIVILRHRAESTLSVGRRTLASLTRSAALGCIIVALAGPVNDISNHHPELVVALDASHSVGNSSRTDSLTLINQLIENKQIEQRMGVVVFGADAAVESSLRADVTPLDELSVSVDREGSNLQRGIELAISRFSTSGARRIVLISDGQETDGEVRAAAAAARATNTQIFIVPVDSSERNDVVLRKLSTPESAQAHAPFSVRITVQSNLDTTAELVLLRNGKILNNIRTRVTPGNNSFAFADTIERPGLYEYEAVVNAEADEISENNRYQAFVKISGPARVAHVVRIADRPSPLTQALRTQGMDVEVFEPSALPGTLYRLSDYNLVILNDISAFELSRAKLDLLEEYVRDTGGGLIAIGGKHSFSAGGYQGTALESLLPVTMDVPAEIRIPSLIVTVLIDRSGSMSAAASGQEKLAIAKNAAFAAIEVLNPLDRIGVLAFSNDFEWIVPITEAGHRRAIAARLRQLNAGGGTNLYRALREAHTVMRQQAAKIKHLIVLSDGLSDEERGASSSFDALSKQLADDRITVSTVAFGHDANQQLMRRLARLGSGRFYFTANPRNVPRIFTSETVILSRGLIVEGATQPQLARPSTLLQGFSSSPMPDVLGYLRVHAKPSAEALLTASDGDPLLVAWQYGLGRSLAFTSDLGGRWGRHWVDWPRFNQLAAQMARWTMRRESRLAMRSRLTHQAAGNALIVDITDGDERFVNGLALSAVITQPRGEPRNSILEQVAPGRYQASVANAGPGRYYANISTTTNAATNGDPAPSIPPQTFGAAIPYSEEYSSRGTDRRTLAYIAATTGGTTLEFGAAAITTLLEAQAVPHQRRGRAWWPWMLAALCLLVAEAALRRVPMPAAWRRLWRRNNTQNPSPGDEPNDSTYPNLVQQISARREAHLAALAQHDPYAFEDPASRARLFTPKSHPRAP
jgi:Ca-activated chloride channel homolog